MVSQLRGSRSTRQHGHRRPVILGTYTSGLCPAAANTVDCIPSEFDSHSIGTVRSAPDGTLYVGSGDGASYYVVDSAALRTYDEQRSAGRSSTSTATGRGLAGHPFCPADTDLTQVCTKIYAKGFRNPFRFDLRPGGGLASATSAGTRARSSTSSPAGGGRNYGWPCYEGTAARRATATWSQCAAEYAKREGTPRRPAPAGATRRPAPPPLGGPTTPGGALPGRLPRPTLLRRLRQGLHQAPRPHGRRRCRAFATGWPGRGPRAPRPDGDLAYVTSGDPARATAPSSRFATRRQPRAGGALDPDRTSGPAPLTVAFDATHLDRPRRRHADLPLGLRRRDARARAPTPSQTYTAGGTYTATLTVDRRPAAAVDRDGAITVGNARRR